MVAFPVSYGFTKFIEYRIDSDARHIIEKVAPIVTPEELYNGFSVDEDTKKTLLKADRFTRQHFSRSYVLNASCFGAVGPVSVDLEASMPRGYETLTASSVFAPIFKFAQEWSILYYMVEKVMPLIARDSISAVFPWVPDLIREEDYSFEKGARNYRFYNKYMIRQGERVKCDSCIRAAMKAPKNIPLVPSVVRDAIGLGNKLYTQVRLLRDRPNRSYDEETQVKVKPRPDGNYVPQSIRLAVDEMKAVTRNSKYGYEE